MRQVNDQQGLSLVELLVSIVVAMIVLGGVISVVVTSRQTFVNEQEASFMQENLRYAVELISRDVRQAGYTDCAVPESSWHVSSLSDPSGLYGENALIGYEGSSDVSGFPTALSQAEVGSDAFIVRYADQADAKAISGHTAGPSNVFSILSESAFEDGDLLFIADATCLYTAVFRAANVTSSSITQTVSGISCTNHLLSDAGGGDVDCTGATPASKQYDPGSIILPFRSHAYFIADSNVIPGVPALKRRVFTATGQRTEELAQGIESMEIFYGVDDERLDPSKDSNGIDKFLRADQIANTDWDSVVAMRITLVLRSQAEFFSEDTKVTIDDTTYEDRYLRQHYSGSFILRNRSVI